MTSASCTLLRGIAAVVGTPARRITSSGRRTAGMSTASAPFPGFLPPRSLPSGMASTQRMLRSPLVIRKTSRSGNVVQATSEGVEVAQAGDEVEVNYTGKLDDGTEFDSTKGRGPLKFKVGAGQLISGFDDAVMGLGVGESKKVTLEPRQGYGEWKQELLVRIPLTEAPGDYVAGQAVQLSNGQVAKVTDVTDEHVEIDANHQLAGKTLNFDIELVSLTSSQNRFPFKRDEQEWKTVLSDFEFKVLRQKGTEPAGSGEYDKFYPEKGYFACRGCEAPLYSAQSKFDSGCGWPAFDKCYEGSITTETDFTYGMKRVEILCANCGGHMGHVFEGERLTDTDERHCVNSASVKFVDSPPPEGLKEAKVV